MKPITSEAIQAKFHPGNENQRKALSVDGYKRAAVLVPLVQLSDGFHLLFTKRTEGVETHKGQISFPGGMVDPTDTDTVHTALREAQEEIGLPTENVVVVGQLDDLATPSRFVITPVVGIIRSLPTLMPSKEEVDEVFYVPLSFFADAVNGRSERREFGGKHHDVWYYDWQEKTIWGATANMIRSLLKQLELL